MEDQARHPPSAIAKSTLSTCVFLGSSFLFWGVYLFSSFSSIALPALFGAVLFGWLGSIQLLNRAARFFPSSWARPIHWIHAMTFEGFAIAGIVLSHPTRLFRKTDASIRPPQGKPILLIHGYFNDSTVWLYQKKQLQAAGFGPVYTIDLGYPFLSLIDYSRRVAEKAKLIAEETGREDLTLIGYSMGGLVGIWYATQIAPKGKVADVITIGAPLAGTPVARIGIGRNAREMQRHSDFLQKIREAIFQNPQIRFYHIASKSDEISFPGGSTGLIGNHPERQFLIEDVGHAGLIYSSRVSQKICGWLKQTGACP